MAICVVNQRSNLGTMQVVRDYSEPLISQKETTSYSERIFSVTDFQSTPQIQDLVSKENMWIRIYRQMARNPYIDFAIEDIVNEMLSADDEVIFPVTLDLSKTNFSSRIRKRIHEEFSNIMRCLEFNHKGFIFLRDWYIDGRAYYFVDIDEKKHTIKQIIALDPLKTKKNVKINKDGTETITYVYTDSSSINGNTIYEIPSSNIVEITSGLMDDDHQIWISYLNKAYVPLNQLSSIEDALVIYRLSRAPERRVFYVDVGELPKSKAENYMKELIRNYRNKMEYDSATGTIKEQVRHSSLLDDIWLPRRNGSQGTEVSTIQGNSSFLQNLEDIDYFLKKLFRSLNVPFSHFTDGEGTSNVIGRTTEITRDELKYAKFINRLRSAYNVLFFKLLQKQLEIKRVVKGFEFELEAEGIVFIWNHDSMFTEFKNLDITRERLGLLSDIMQYIGKFYSLKWVQKNILHQTDEEIKEMSKDIDHEKMKYKEMGIYPESPDGEPIENSAFGDRENDEEDEDSFDNDEDTGEEDYKDNQIDSNKENPRTKPKLGSATPKFEI